MTKCKKWPGVMGFGFAALLAVMPEASVAALSGYYDSAAQIAVLLESAELANALRQQPIESIEFDGVSQDGLLKWEIQSAACELEAYLRGMPPEGVGATQYRLERITVCD